MAIFRSMFELAITLTALAQLARSWECNGNSGPDDLSEGERSSFFPYAHCFDHLSPDHFNATENRNGIIPDKYRWPWGQIPYVLEQSALQSPYLQKIYEGIDMIHNSTCLRLFPRTDQVNYLTIRTDAPNGGCFCSGVGMRGGPQVVNLEMPGCGLASTAAHELLHGAGLWHEHARPDRDQYIFVDFQNTCKKTQSNYFRCDEGEAYQLDGCSAFGEAYNVESIMHYPGLVPDRNFAVDINLPIMKSLPGFPPIPNGDNAFITKEDASKINKMYKNCQ